MQLFGKIKSKHELEYIVKTYLYINTNEENTISSKDLELLLKKKNKNVAGTVFLYNPFTVPKGYNKEEKLIDQGFIFSDKFVELEIDDATRVVSKSLKKFEGKLIEIKYLFNYNKENIQPTSVLEVFDMDIEKLHTNQLTVFSKEYNFQDYKNISYNGKFIFFAWGHKFEKSHTNISTYATNIAQWATKQGKEIGFIYDATADKDDSFEYTRFIHPVAFGKMKQLIPKALERVFEKETIEPLCLKDIV